MRPIVEEVRRVRRLDADPRQRDPRQVGNKGSDQQCPQWGARRPPVNREGGGKVRRVHYPRSPGCAVRWIKNNRSAGMAKSSSSTITSAVLMGVGSLQRLCLTNAPLHVMILFELPRLAAVM